MYIPSQPLKDQAMVPNEGYRQAAYVTPPADVASTDIGYVILSRNAWCREGCP